MKILKYQMLFLFAVLPLIAASQEEPEAQFLKNRNDFVDTIPYVVVNADRPQWTISKYLNGSHFVYAFENDALYKDESIAKWMQDSKTAIIRWPGGTVVQYYHWDDLNGIPFKNDSWDPDYNGETLSGDNFMDLDEYIAFCRKANTEPMVGLNLRSGKAYNRLGESLDEARRLITYCKEKNYNVKHWYMGNEGYAKGFKAKEYAAYIDQYAKVLKSVDPDIEIIGDWKFGPYKKNRFEESIDIAKISKEVDVLEFHEKWGNIWGLKSGHTVEEWRNEFPLYDGKLTTLLQRLKDETRRANKTVKFGFNEWGLGDIKGAQEYDYAIIAADFMLEMFKNDVYQACYWNLNAGKRKSRVFNTNEEGTKLLHFNPIADVFKMFSTALQKEYLYVLSNDKSIYGFGAKDVQTGSVTVYLLNKNEKDTLMKLGVFGFGVSNAKITIERFSNPGTIDSKTLENANMNKKVHELELPPYSLSKITISPLM
ncbi:hypothetical protein [Tamlana sp. I1]|uniref:hypothetical protein n=1 Tax=Tamlana sp. I1 TaxID=2762061 RepID=UPI00188FF244|nr:hypothetical protein [Tamlana sp. I1]